MRFIRENLFYLIVVAGVVVLGGALLAVDYSVSADVTTEIAARKDLSDRLTRFASAGNLVNPSIVAAEANRVRATVDEANRIIVQQRLRNQMHTPYRVLSLPVIGPGQQTVKQQPAFPYDANMYRDYELALQFIALERAELQTQLQRLEPTRPPTPEEIKVAEGILRAQNPAAPAAAGATAATDPILAKATDYAIYEKASGGRAYVDDAVIAAEAAFPEGRTTADQSSLWIMQYKLWIATDVIAAIKAANEEGLKDLLRQERNVLNAPVKRFAGLKVSPTYSTKGGEVGTAVPLPDAGAGSSGAGPVSPMMPGGSSGAGPRGPGPMGPGPMGPGPMGPGPMGPGPMGPGAGGYSGGGTGFGNIVLASGETVTQRYCDQNMDVVQYSFQVVMPTRHVPLLIKTVMQDRNHTVLSYKAQEAPRIGNYFYGNEPVMLVTLTCEAIFLTTWERDLVPAGFLKTLPASALRASDNERLK